MIKTIREACKFNPIIHEYQMSESVENLSALIDEAGNGQTFFARNFMTHGMEQLAQKSLRRLSSKSDQAVFELTQAMGGGKTHMMIAIGLLARYPELRRQVLSRELNADIDFEKAKIAAFSGRYNPDHYIWGEIASQLGQSEMIRSHWVNGPRAVDQKDWKRIIGHTPTLILLDELPPYLDYASTQAYGSSTLASMVVYSMSNLMQAALELPNCCIIIANLSDSYHAQTKELSQAISNLHQETRRQAETITPVELAGNEIYEILKKRLITTLPDKDVIDDVANTYARLLKKAEDSGFVPARSITNIAEQIRQTYPFHPSFKHLIALFKENEGFRQTRGLMQFTARLLKSVEQRQSDDVYLIGTQHLALDDHQVRAEIEQIASTHKLGTTHNNIVGAESIARGSPFTPAITHDIADNGGAVAQVIDKETGGDAAQQIMTLLLVSSLSRAVGGRIGLLDHEITEFLLTPSSDTPETFGQALTKLREQAWYLHREDERLFVKDTENLSRRIEQDIKGIPQTKVDQVFKDRLIKFLSPKRSLAYQSLHVFPKLDELKLGGHRSLIVVKPDGKRPSEEMKNFFDYQLEKNNFLILTGEDSLLADTVEERLREICAIEQIKKTLKECDTIFEEAEEKLKIAEDRFQQALSSAYNRVYFPRNEKSLAAIPIENSLKLGIDQQSTEQQIEDLLKSPRADYKLATDLAKNLTTYFDMAEQYLWPSGIRRTTWTDMIRRSRENALWPWMPGAGGMDNLKNEAIKKGRWRIGEDGYIEKSPFPKDRTAVTVSFIRYDSATGQTILSITPRCAGENPLVLYSPHKNDIEKGQAVKNLDYFATKAGTLYFLAKDKTGKYETGEPYRWVVSLNIRHQIEPYADKRSITLQCTPEAELFYTIDGSNPKEGTFYEKPFAISQEQVILLVYAQLDEANTNQKFLIPASSHGPLQIDNEKPAKLLLNKIVLDTREKVYNLINRFRDYSNLVFKGVRIEIGEGEHAIIVLFGERSINALAIEETINSLQRLFPDNLSIITITIADHNIKFPSGLLLKEFAKIANIQIKPSIFEQEY